MSPMPRTVNRRLFCLFISGCSFIAVTRSALETRSPTGCVWIPTTEFTAWIWQFGGAHNDVCPPGKIPVKIPLSSKDILKCKTKFFLLGTCPMWRIWIVCFMKQGPSTSRSTNGTCPKWRIWKKCFIAQNPLTSPSTIGTCPIGSTFFGLDLAICDLAISWDGKSQNRNDWLDFFLSVARLRLGFGPSKG